MITTINEFKQSLNEKKIELQQDSGDKLKISLDEEIILKHAKKMFKKIKTIKDVTSLGSSDYNKLIKHLYNIKQPLNENFNSKVKITPDVYDGEPIKVFTLVDAQSMTFDLWESAIEWLIDTLKMDEELYNYLRMELSTKDDVIIGDIKMAGMDIIDHLPLVEQEDEEEFNEAVNNEDDDVDLSKELKNQLYIGDFE